jgi:hypothetical protein
MLMVSSDDQSSAGRQIATTAHLGHGFIDGSPACLLFGQLPFVDFSIQAIDDVGRGGHLADVTGPKILVHDSALRSLTPIVIPA